MQKFYCSLMVAASMLCAANAYCDPFNFDDGIIELGKVYDVPSYVEASGTIVAPTDGILIQDGVSDLRIAGLEPLDYGGLPQYGEYGQKWEWRVKGGETYTVSSSFVFNGGKVVFNMDSEVGLKTTSILPAEGATITTNVNLTGEIVINFNTSASCESAKLIAGDTQISLGLPATVSTMMAFSVKNAIRELYQTGAADVNGGTPAKLRLTGVQSINGHVYNGDGVIELNYVIGPKTMTLLRTNCVNGRMLSSYYPAGDQAGILTFTFDQDVLDDGQTFATLGCGNPEKDSYYYETVYATVDGATVTVDLTNKYRNLSGLDPNNLVGFKLSNVRDRYGYYAEGNADGNVGSYDYTLVYDYVPPIDVASEFLPASGASLSTVDEIEIWFNNSDMLSYDGVLFALKDKKIVVPKSELKIEEGTHETTLLVPVPQEAKTQAVTVTLNNLVARDGLNHTQQIMALYNQFSVELIAPITQGQAIESTTFDDFVIRCNMDPGYMRYDFYNQPTEADPTGWAYGTTFAKQTDGTWTAYNNDYACYTNFNPYMRIRAYVDEDEYYKNPANTMGDISISFIGMTEAFKYSSYNFESIDPEGDTVLYAPFNNFYFTATFDGLVTLDPDITGIVLGMGQGLTPFEKIEAAGTDSEDPEGYANTWRLYPSAQYLNNNPSITISLRAFDIDGLMVRGNMGENEEDYLTFYYPISNPDNYRQLTITPGDGESLESIDKFIVSYPEMAVGLNYTATDYPTITNEAGVIVYTFAEGDLTVVSEQLGIDDMGYPIYDEITSVEMVVNPAIMEPGTYVLTIPQRMFVVGSQYDTQPSKEYVGVYTVESTGEINLVPADADGLYTVYNLHGMRVLAGVNAAALRTLRPGVYVVNGVKVRIR